MIAISRVTINTTSIYDGSSNSVILHLVHGDIVDLGLCSAIGKFYPGPQTSFSGFQLQED